MTFGISYAAYVQRLTADGRTDVTFGSSSRAGFDFGAASGWDNVTHLALQSDGKIVAAGTTPGSDAVMRLNPDGSLDTGFGLGGKVLTEPSVQGLAIQSDGKLLVAGVPQGAFAVTRWDADGSRDTRFGVAGTATSSFLRPRSACDVALQADGAIVVAGTSNRDFAVARYVGGPSAPLTGTPNQRFVTQLYLDLLERPVDVSGLTFWSRLLDQGTATRADIAQAIETSLEYRTDVIETLYERLLGRAVDPSGLNTWGNFLARGGTVEELEALLVGSAEYWAHSGAATSGFVNAVYRDMLYRTPDSGGAQTWSQALGSGASGSAVAAAILRSPESNANEIQDLYHGYLHRAPEPGGFAIAMSALQQGTSNEQLLAAIAGSDEYFAQL
jgi:uncharacterized delta-60 repeat protein